MSYKKLNLIFYVECFDCGRGWDGEKLNQDDEVKICCFCGSKNIIVEELT